ncbi:hypothetical protein AB0O91_29640 [Kitasatospora sp. NPDC089797]|uniref:hypothetical protein n=1 Tax=Kitasatospora sp. NPDC089797 TaxID=3155298 RepID=UPI00342C14FB
MTFSGSRGRAVLAVGATLLLAACSAGGGGGAAAPSATPSATGTPYGTELDQALKTIGGGLGKAAGARTTADLNIALAAVEADSYHASRHLKGPGTPGGETAHADLVKALGSLSDETGALRADLRGNKVCGLDAGKARLGAGQALSGVSAAVAKLTEAGYRSAFTVPELPEPVAQPRTLENGTMIREGAQGGGGTLEIDDNAGQDAVFTIGRDGTALASVFVAKGQQASIEGIAAGSYDISYTTGTDWDPEARQFTQDCDFVKFQDKHEFTSKGGWTIWKIKIRAQDGRGNSKVQRQDANSAPQP